MSTRELSDIEPLSESETAPLMDSDSSPWDDEIGIKEWCQVRCKPSFQMRKLTNKGAILILIWTCLITSILIIGRYTTIHRANALAYYVASIPIVIVTFIISMLADIRFGRYKVVSCSLWIMWTSSLLLTINSIIMDRVHFEHKQVQLIVLLFPLGLGWAGYQANIIQFGIDQLIDASAIECKSFIIWLCWSYFASPVFVEYVLGCVDDDIYLMLLMSFNTTVALALKLIFSHVLIKEPTTHNPFRLVYRVIKWAIPFYKHTPPIEEG